MHSLTHNPILGHITTFGGHPVCCAAGMASFEKIIGEDLIAGIPEREAVIRTLQEMPEVEEVRGKGMLFAVEVGSFEEVIAVVHECLANGLVTDWFVHCDTAIRLAPPLTITLEELKEGLEILKSAIRTVKQSS